MKKVKITKRTPQREGGAGSTQIDRRLRSEEKLAEVRRRLSDLNSLKPMAGVSIYATGSFGRLEAGRFSDIDLFFLSVGKTLPTRLKQTPFFAEVIALGSDMGFPPFSNDGQYLSFMSIDEMLKELGGPHDDYHNHFTARMLLLLESQPVFNDVSYHNAMKRIVSSYFRDFPDHASDFRPIFLINDIMRFWKTLCLNYEHKRNQPDSDDDKKRRQQVRNFKLKFSRMLTCFGTIAAICALPQPVDQTEVLKLLQDPPLDRLLKAMEGRRTLASTKSKIAELYTWFLNDTDCKMDEIATRFANANTKKAMLAKGREFGDAVFYALQAIAKDTNYIRYLVI